MKYKRILLKLSGEALQGKRHSGIDYAVLHNYCTQVKEVADQGCEIGIVIGGGNIFRGLSGTESGVDRVKGDQMGMLATVINSLALESELHRLGARAKVYTSIRMEPVGRLYNRDDVVTDMSNGIITILGGGTGNPFFTTDTAAALRGVETGASLLLKGTRVDGVYSADPEKVQGALRFDKISFEKVISDQLKVMDQTAFTMCRENNLPIVVFNMNIQGNLKRVVNGEECGTLITTF
ncbi:MAG: UMP kinase [Bacteroidales bacterium]|nr:UMP kinase [Bacteroidales bacterium]